MKPGFNPYGVWYRWPFAMIALAVFATGCSTVNLKSEDSRTHIQPSRHELTADQLKLTIRQRTDPSNRFQAGKTIRIKATDVWESSLVRWFTPLTENRQQFEARNKLFGQGAEFTFLNGEKSGQIIGYGGKQAYRIVDGETQKLDSASIALYLGPLQGYFEWHQALVRKGGSELLGETVINDTRYHVLYVTEGSGDQLEDFDQYRVYVNSETFRVAFVEFTMRELMNSYKGVVHYRDYRRVQGVLMPHWIGIADDIPEPEFDHYFVVDSFTF